MDGKFNLANKVMSIEIVQVVEVVDVVNYDLVVLALLEVIGHFKVLDPLRCEVIHDDLSLANLFPHIAFFLEEDAHTISARKGIQVWQVLTFEGQGYNVDQALVLRN